MVCTGKQSNPINRPRRYELRKPLELKVQFGSMLMTHRFGNPVWANTAMTTVAMLLKFKKLPEPLIAIGAALTGLHRLPESESVLHRLE